MRLPVLEDHAKQQQLGLLDKHRRDLIQGERDAHAQLRDASRAKEVESRLIKHAVDQAYQYSRPSIQFIGVQVG